MDLDAFFRAQPPEYPDTPALGRCLRALIEQGLDRLPLPGSGQTLERWRGLAAVGAHDLRLCKLYEGHTDALSIIAQLDGPAVAPGSSWGMWAAEPPQARVEVRGQGSNCTISGRKAWCSGAAVLSHGLLTAWNENGEQQLVAVDLHQPGVHVTDQGWCAVGMGATGSVEVLFEEAQGIAIGEPGAYLSRPGFWQGGIGIAACWYGAARCLADRLRLHCEQRPEPHALAHLGAVDSALHGATQVLCASARTIDAAPHGSAELLARRVRAVVEHSAERVIEHVGHALGAGPYCKDRQFAQLIADLPVFLRQSHAERDLAGLGQLVATPPSGTWHL
ncbi:acyl-CoA dehydrogenase family protein [Pseudomonas sp. SZMC_28357]|uniref:acyl-CoA dehydrogenase family protein n=1 Tax=Pseudomonas sp. SZMC_28357 TaxID=3074380 RepID=UPI002872A9F6|nr:acyl-CoA dehydrogenase family protein [Pseudomonas sp. SZMC_28357]MDR9753661.1 acyl-CoA dehydrogenase family protein [Pseudomonas sp. SZMC_28357]